jgi:hypothetical protein
MDKPYGKQDMLNEIKSNGIVAYIGNYGLKDHKSTDFQDKGLKYIDNLLLTGQLTTAELELAQDSYRQAHPELKTYSMPEILIAQCGESTQKNGLEQMLIETQVNYAKAKKLWIDAKQPPNLPKGLQDLLNKIHNDALKAAYKK